MSWNHPQYMLRELKEKAKLSRRKKLQLRVDNCYFSVRAEVCLTATGILTLGDLIKKTEDELHTIKNFNKTEIRMLKEILGLSLKEGK